jgi:hypothetical protein
MPSTCRSSKDIGATTKFYADEPISTWENMAQASTSLIAEGASQGPIMTTNNNPSMNIYMMNLEDNIATRAQDYRMLEYFKKGKEATNPLNPLQIENSVSETMIRILKGAFKRDSHNLNARVTYNYYVVEYLEQTPNTMYSLEVL